MKWYLTIFIFSYFINVLPANDPPRLQSTVKVLSIPTIQFLPDYLRKQAFFQKNTTKQPQPLSTFFHPNLSNSKNQYRAWSYEELAFFCKIEVQMEKAAKLPIKFRLGEVQQVERMEGKYE
ncbi:MAG: hypothetical protein AB8G22_18200 [Saprospiraceae bacterium]